MIFKNINPNGFISRLMRMFQLNLPHITLRFNAIKNDEEGFHCIIKCSATKMKAYINISDDGVKVIGYERVANTPVNILVNHREIFSEIFPSTDDLDIVYQALKKVLITKSEALVHIQNGNNEFIQGTTNLADINDKNVFYGIIRKAQFTETSLIVTFHTGFTYEISKDKIENILGISNCVGRYMVINNKQQIAVMAKAKFETMIKE